MNGYGSHTYKWYNEEGEYFWVQYHFKTDQGIKNLTGQEAQAMKGKDPDHATRDLSDSIARGEFPSWTLYVQIMTPKEATDYRFDPFDVTKVWPHVDYPLRSRLDGWCLTATRGTISLKWNRPPSRLAISSQA